jgi:lysophospholipase L1-like esterase
MISSTSRLFSPFCLTSILMAIFAAPSWGAELSSQPNHFEKDIAAFEAADAKTPPPQGAILFVGDSTYTRWKSIHDDLPEYTVINRGFGGSQMSDLLYYTDRIVLRYHPRMIVVQEGGNDIHGGKSPDRLLADIKAFIEKVRASLPDTPIVIGSITGNSARWSEIETRRRANQIVKEFVATQKNVVWVNFFDPFLGADGKPREELFVEDHMHPSHAGYALRAQILRPILGAPDHQPASGRN